MSSSSTAQVANVLHPNTVKNTIPICIFDEKDTPGNLYSALSMYQQQVRDLMATQWKGKKLRVFLFGDYEFQCHVFGLSGPSGVRPCIHCHCMKRSMDLDPSSGPEDETTARSLETLAADHQRYTTDGSRLSRAKLFNNVIRPTILPIPVADAVIPALHLDLGIFVWII